MIKVCVIAVGKIKERDFSETICEYQKRLNAFCQLSIIEIKPVFLPENPSQGQITAALKEEASAIIAKMPKGAAVYTLCVEGKSLSSEAFAKTLKSRTDEGKNLCFIIGGSHGLCEEVKKQGERLSFSDMTFPHRLFRVMLLEQIYRAFTINAGSKYHK